MTQNSIDNSASSLDVDNINIDGNTISSTDTNGNIVLAPDGTGTISVTLASIVPSGDRADSLGSATNSWDNVYADGFSFNDGTDVMATYEKGTFTPVLELGGDSSGFAYDAQVGAYWKIGSMVFIFIHIDLSADGTGTGNATITGLPFTSANDSVTQILSMGCARTGFTTGASTFFAQIDPNTSVILLKNCGTNVNTALTDAEIEFRSNFEIDGFYWTT